VSQLIALLLLFSTHTHP